MNQQQTTAGMPMWQQLAIQRGLLPADGVDAEADPSPWLIAVLLAGTLVCAIFVMLFFGMLLNELLTGFFGGLCAVVLFGGSVGVLRERSAVFVQCLAVVGMAIGMVWLGVVVVLVELKHDEWTYLWAVQFVMVAVSACTVNQRWVLKLLGLYGALCFMALMMVFDGLPVHPQSLFLWVVTVQAAMWVILVWNEVSLLSKSKAMRWLAVADGWVLGVLILCVAEIQLSSWYFGKADVDSFLGSWLTAWPSLLVPLAGWAMLARWRSKNAEALQGALPWLWLSVAVVTVLSVFMSSLAVVAVVAAVAAATARWRLLAGCGLAALVCVSGFYYDLSWPLAHKAALLAALGLVLGLALWLGTRQEKQSDDAIQGLNVVSARRWQTAAMGLAAVAIFGLVNLDVWRKEGVIAQGEVLYVPLAPVDPRSLMQGDYMDLRFDIPSEVREALNQRDDRAVSRYAQVVVNLNALNVATVVRMAKAQEVLAADERLMPLKRLKGRWTLVTDAYFFPEGDAERFEAASFGEFRVLPDGRALLIGLMDKDRQPIRSPHDLRD